MNELFDRIHNATKSPAVVAFDNTPLIKHRVAFAKSGQRFASESDVSEARAALFGPELYAAKMALRDAVAVEIANNTEKTELMKEFNFKKSPPYVHEVLEVHTETVNGDESAE